MPDFPHLQLRSEVAGLYKSNGGGKRKAANTLANISNRQAHGTRLATNLDQLSSNWTDALARRQESDLPILDDSNIAPIFLQVDPNVFDVEALKGLGLEVIAEEDDGFIIGAGTHDFTSLRLKIDSFLNQDGSRSQNQAAQLWQINEGFQWRIDYILSDDLRSKWNEIDDEVFYVVDVGIACYVKIPNQPEQLPNESAERYQIKLVSWETKRNEKTDQREQIAADRQDKFGRLIASYNGEFLSGYIDYDDSFCCRIRINGKGLKDLVLTYQFLFEVVEHDPFMIPSPESGETIEVNPEVLPPLENSPKICVIDSGIQEGHRLLAEAILQGSHSFIPGDNSVADSVVNGGHGTRVAGAILYPRTIPRSGQYRLPFFLQNARVLSGPDGILSSRIFPPILMQEITDRFNFIRVFNLSINSHRACRTVHMSQWSASIDKLIHGKDILFIISAGNISKLTGSIQNPGIKEHLRNSRNYPDYLFTDASRIANPAQSCFAITVGSICHTKYETTLKESFGAAESPSSFSRTGLGLWGMVKPDVVEYGGDFVKERNDDPNISLEMSSSPELVRSTLNSGSAIGNDDVGTSYAAPKVSHIAAELLRTFPRQPANLYRVLIAQSARLPGVLFERPTIEAIRNFGYGLPHLGRATQNSERRVTLIDSGFVAAKKAKVYSVSVPNQMRGPAQEFDVLVEVTLAFTAKPRRTRRRTQAYLSTWVSWVSSKLGESYEHFCQAVIQNLTNEAIAEEDQQTFPWIIRERPDHGILGLRRQDSTLQKSWCILKAYQLPEELSIAVVGHKGWDKDITEEVPYSIAVSFEALNANINVYEMIRVENEIQVELEVQATR